MKKDKKMIYDQIKSNQMKNKKGKWKSEKGQSEKRNVALMRNRKKKIS